MKKLITTEDILNDPRMFTKEQADSIRANVAKEVDKIRGGKRAGAGRKPSIAGCLRSKQVKVTEDTKEAIQYAYSIGVVINLADVELLKYVKEHGLTLEKLQQA